jgi:ABC-type multidrug transport system fused ATPase/permease subunit
VVFGTHPNFSRAFGGLVLISLYFLRRDAGANEILPILALYGFSGYRLMPAMQQMYLSFTRIRCHKNVVDLLVQELHLPHEIGGIEAAGIGVTFAKKLRISHLFYSYPQRSGEVLSDISLEIHSNSTVGFVGKSGSGKTTLIDVVLGLLKPSAGRIEVDDIVIEASNLSEWQKLIGYVPQHIYLTDDTILANIAFGIPAQVIDRHRVEEVARLARLDSFISSLSAGYDTVVGERGVQLSGGQRQRIGIARALYSNPKILILDEATSALDNSTENEVMEAVKELSGKKTILIIAHRLTTLKFCDCVYLLDGGKVSGVGTYEQLVKENSTLRSVSLS